MKSGSRPAGFTIIEVLIVLAVTMALFLAAVILINGRQNHTEFGLGVRQIQQQLQQTINEVSNGYYTSDGTIKCIGNSATGPLVSQQAAGVGRGTNQDCAFIGKVIQFSQANQNPERFYTYTIAGLRDNGLGNVPDLASLQPTIIDYSSGVFDSSIIPYGITTVKAYYGTNPNNPAQQVSAIGFVSSEGQLGGDDISGQVNVIAVPATNITRDQSSGAADIKANLKNAVVNPAGGVHVCMVSGGTKESALYTIGSDGKNTTVTESIIEDQTC